MEELKLTILEERRSRFDVLRMWLPRLGVALLFIVVGKGKFAAHSEWVAIFDRIGFGQSFRYFTGMLQIVGGTLVLIPKTFLPGILLLACSMLGAMGAWVFLLGEPLNALVPGALLLGLLAVGGEDLLGLTSSRKRK